MRRTEVGQAQQSCRESEARVCADEREGGRRHVERGCGEAEVFKKPATDMNHVW